MSNLSKKKYKRFCEEQEDMPIFLTYEWINSIAGDDEWDVAITEIGREVMAVLPYFIRKKLGQKILGQPPLTPYLGPWIKYPSGQKYAKQLSHEKKCLYSLIEQLPSFDDFNMKFHPRITNGLPFQWKGFNESIAYTYVLEDLKNKENLFNEFRGNIRRQVKKGQKELKVEETDDITLVYQLKELSYSEKEDDLPYEFKDLQKVDELCKRKKCRKIWVAMDSENHVHSILYLIWDKNSSYYLIGSSDPRFKNSGAMSLLMWKAIQFSTRVTKKFNFEGSMIEPIERYFRAFGGKQTPYHVISKTRSPLIRFKRSIK